MMKATLKSLLAEVTCKMCKDVNDFAEPNQPDGSFVCRSCREHHGIKASAVSQPEIKEKGSWNLEKAKDVIKNLADPQHSPDLETAFDELIEWLVDGGVEQVYLDDLIAQVASVQNHGFRKYRGGGNAVDDALTFIADIFEQSGLAEGFDKFMSEICEGEKKRAERNVDVEVDTPARVYQKRYREYHNNRIVYRKVK